MSMAGDPQTSGHGERFSKIIITQPQCKVAQHQRDRCIYAQQLTYASSVHVHCSTNFKWSSLVLSQRRFGSTTFSSQLAQRTGKSSTTYPPGVQARQLHHMTTMRQSTDNWMEMAQWRYKSHEGRLIGNFSQLLYARQHVDIDSSP